MSNRPFHSLPGSSSLTGRVYANGASAATAIKDNLAAVANPTSGDSSAGGYGVGSIWINVSTSPRRIFMCVDATAGAAVWLNISQASVGVGVRSYTLGGSNVDLVWGTDKRYQSFDGILSGDVIINAPTATPVEGNEFFIKLNAVALNGHTLTIQSGGAGYLVQFTGSETVSGTIWLVYNGSSWIIFDRSTIET